MVYIRDKWVLLFLGSILFYLFLNWCSVFGQYSIYTNHLVVLYILYGVGFFIFNHRLFLMSRRKLSMYIKRLGVDTAIRYKIEERGGLIRHIYIQINKDGYPDWYELDYILCGIEKGSGYNIYNTFKVYNSTLGDLMHTMCSLANDKLIGEKYNIMKYDYRLFNIIGFLSCTFISMVYIIILFNFILSYDEVNMLYDLLGM